MNLYLLSPSFARPTMMDTKVEFLSIGQSKKVPIIGENGTFRVYKTAVNPVLVKSPSAVVVVDRRCLLLIRGALQGNLNEAIQQGVVLERELNGPYGDNEAPSEALLAIYSPGALLVFKGQYYLWTGVQWLVSEAVDWPNSQYKWSIYLAEQNIGGQFL